MIILIQNDFQEGHTEGVELPLKLYYKGVEQTQLDKDEVISLCRISMPVNQKRNMMNASSNYRIIDAIIETVRIGVNMKNFYIAGASSRARTARVYLEYLNADMKISAFLVSPEMTDNESVLDGVPVLKIKLPLDTSFPVYLGTRGVNHPKLENELRAIGFTDIIPIDMRLDLELRNAYLAKFYSENGREFVRMDMLDAEGREENTEKSAIIYVANSIFDGELKDKYSLLPEEEKIQVGCALTEKRLEGCSIFDNTGDNISKLNRQFCELTGLYWIWKNAREDYVGLVHYRRHFLLQSDWPDVCVKNNIDAILPVPLYVSPGISENYRERHIASDWDFLMDYFEKELPDEYDDMIRILGGNLYSPCNMIIAKREVLSELCSWMFPIIFAVYEHGEKSGIERDPYQSRYPGFVSERLMTYFFESRRDRFNVVYCNKNFLN